MMDYVVVIADLTGLQVNSTSKSNDGAELEVSVAQSCAFRFQSF